MRIVRGVNKVPTVGMSLCLVLSGLVCLVSLLLESEGQIR